MGDETFPFDLPPDPLTLLSSPTLSPEGGTRFQRMAAQEEEFDRGVADTGVRQTSMSRGTSGYRVRLDATRIAHQARSWNELASLVRQQFSSHGVSGPEDAKLLIDTATAAYGADHGSGEGAWYYGLALQKEYDDKQATARRHQIDARARQLEADPILRARLEWQDRARKLADETGVEYIFAAEFVKEFERSTFSFPGVIDPRSLPFIQAEIPLYQSAYLISQYILPFTPVGPLLAGYEAITGKNLLTGERLPMWERILNIVTSLLPFVHGAVKVGIKASMAVLSRGAKVMAGLARELRVGAKSMLRFAAKLARLPAAKVQALLERIVAARRAAQGLRLAADEVRLAGQVDEALKELDVLESGARPGSRTASGVIDDSRALSRTQSGTLSLKPTPSSAGGTAVGAGAAKALSKTAKALVDAGYLPQAVEALTNLGVKVTAEVAASLKALGPTGRDFVNLFHQSKGFQRVVADLARGGSKRIGAEFVMRFAASHPDILAKVRINPLLVAFEWGAGIKKTQRFGDIFAREVDIVVRGDAAIGEADTIYHELKSWTESTLRASKGKKLPHQLVRDTALLDPHNIRWVFNQAKIGNKSQIIGTFVELIQRDAYLAKAWGSDRAAITAALDRVITMFPLSGTGTGIGIHQLRQILSALFPCRDSRQRWASGPAACADRLPLPRCRLSRNHVRRVSLQLGSATRDTGTTEHGECGQKAHPRHRADQQRRLHRGRAPPPRPRLHRVHSGCRLPWGLSS